jgi:hypothetical protein
MRERRRNQLVSNVVRVRIAACLAGNMFRTPCWWWRPHEPSGCQIRMLTSTRARDSRPQQVISGVDLTMALCGHWEGAICRGQGMLKRAHVEHPRNIRDD